jgi:hypothetical protein
MIDLTVTYEPTNEAGNELGKRFYAPGYTLHSTCPKCGETWESNLGGEYISYPTVNKPKEIMAYCPECQHEWCPGSVIVRISIEVANKKEEQSK